MTKRKLKRLEKRKLKRLVNLLERSNSNNDAEALSAIRFANKLLEQEKLYWPDITFIDDDEQMDYDITGEEKKNEREESVNEEGKENEREESVNEEGKENEREESVNEEGKENNVRARIIISWNCYDCDTFQRYEEKCSKCGRDLPVGTPIDWKF